MQQKQTFSHFLLAALTLLATKSQAQKFVGYQVIERPKFGVHVGGNWAAQTTGYYSDYGSYDSWGNYYESSSADYTKTKFGLTAGLEVELPLGKGMYLQPEANYTQMGGKGNLNYQDDKGNTQSYPGKYNYNYIQLPILFKYKPKITGFGILIGPQYSYLISTNNTIKGIPGKDESSKDWSTKNEFGIVAGCEYYIPTQNNKPQIGFSLRYVAGITNVMNRDKYFTLYPNDDHSIGSIRNAGIMLTTGIRF